LNVVCPNCGNHFDRPIITVKRSGLGFTIGPLGAIKCPNCGYKAGWGAFKREKDVPSGVEYPAAKKMPSQSTPEEEKEKSLEDTKFEQ